MRVQKTDKSAVGSREVEAPAAGFNGSFEPMPVSLGYRIGLAAVCLGMALLLAVYVGLIGLAAYGVYYHLSIDAAMISGTGAATSIFLYLWPAVAGAVLVFFMIKPILAARPEQPPKYSLTPQSDPTLFALIGRICALVRAPLPSRVDVDCQINASAGFRRGLWSIRGNDVVLTIGLPLAAGLSRQEFAGVLAHEFGHFAQNAGMRLTYLIRAMSAWFARVVYERDEWDVLLVRTAYRTNGRLSIFVHLIRFTIWLSRRILWVLMYLGHAISCLMLRQMEYNADTHETCLAGSEAFARTAVKLRRLQAAGQLAGEKVQESWNRRRLPENLPAFINACIRNTPAELQAKVEAAARKTRFLDTHPCDADRVKAASVLDRPGIFHNDQPASELFNDFDGLCRAATRFHYEHNLALCITEQNLVSHEASERESLSQAEGEQALKEFCFGLQLKFRPLQVLGSDERELFPGNLSESVRLARSAMEESRPAVQKALAEYEQAERAYQRGLEAISQSAQQSTARAAQTMQSLAPVLETFERHAQTRLAAALRFLNEAALAGKISGAAAVQAEAARLTPVFARLGAAFGPLHELRRQLGAFTAALDAGAREERRTTRLEQAQARANELAPKIKELIKQVDSLLGDVPYPFQDPRKDLTLAAFAKSDMPASNRVQVLCNEGACHLERLLPLYQRVLGRLAFIALTVERQL
ncbi:MAG TPA: M48 family metalloprotease [Dongiaceae bacterium]|nr:M48 family metalloprotease [Dongiaceae bacterium]